MHDAEPAARDPHVYVFGLGRSTKCTYSPLIIWRRLTSASLLSLDGQEKLVETQGTVESINTNRTSDGLAIANWCTLANGVGQVGLRENCAH